MKSLHFIALASFCASFSAANGQALGVAGNFNDFILGNATQSNVDAQGIYAVGGNANFTDFTINSGFEPLYSGYGMITGGTYTNSYAAVGGGVYSGSTFTAVDPTIKGGIASDGSVNLSGFGTVTGNITYGTSYSNLSTTVMGSVGHTTTSSPLDFGADGTFLRNLSESLAGQASNGTTTLSGSNLTLTGTNATLDVFSVTAAQLAASTNLQISAPSTATVLVNVAGTSESLSGGLSLSGVNASHVLYNFADATSLSMSGIGVLGTILAPNGALNFSTGDIDGEIIAGSLTGSVESHNNQFDGDLPSGSPEPVTLAMPAVLVGLWLRRRLKAA
jgi:choice-of-anchor A domain-containing protein